MCIQNSTVSSNHRSAGRSNSRSGNRRRTDTGNSPGAGNRAGSSHGLSTGNRHSVDFRRLNISVNISVSGIGTVIIHPIRRTHRLGLCFHNRLSAGNLLPHGSGRNSLTGHLCGLHLRLRGGSGLSTVSLTGVFSSARLSRRGVHNGLIGFFFSCHFLLIFGKGGFSLFRAFHCFLGSFYAFLNFIAVLFFEFGNRSGGITDDCIKFADFVGNIADTLKVLRTVFNNANRTGKVARIQRRQSGPRIYRSKHKCSRDDNADANAFYIYHTTLRLGLCHINNNKKKQFYKSLLCRLSKI